MKNNMKRKETQQIEKALEMLKQANTIQCITLDDGEDIEVDLFDPHVEYDQDIAGMVIAGTYGTLFTDDFSDCEIENNTIKTKQYQITIV